MNEESVTNIIKDIDCIQETQQHSVTIEHGWSIRDICDLISSKRPGEKIESDQFSYESTDFKATCKCCEENHGKIETSRLSILPSSYSLDFELAVDYLIKNTQWRLEINKSSTDINNVTVSALLFGITDSKPLDSNIFNRLEQLETDFELILKINFYILNDKMTEVFDNNFLEVKLDLKKSLQQLSLRNTEAFLSTRKNFLIERYQLNNFFQIKNFLNWLNHRKSDDFCLISEFKIYRKNLNFNDLPKPKYRVLKSTLQRPKLNSLLLLNFKNSWTIKNWRNFLMPGTTSHTFLNDYEISSIFGKKSKLLNEFGEEFDANSTNLSEIETVKFGKFRSKLFSLIQAHKESNLDHECMKSKIDGLLKDVKWKLQLYPNGYSQEYENNLSLFVNFSQLTGDLSQFTPGKNKSLNTSTLLVSNKSIEETFYDSNEDYGVILLIKSPPSNYNGDLDEIEEMDIEIDRKSRKKNNFFETFVKASFQISIFDSNGKKVDKCQSEKQLFELFGSWGYKEYMNASDLIDLKDKYLSNNNTTLNLNCKIILFYTVTTKTSGSSLLDIPFIIKNDLLELKNSVSSTCSENSSSSSSSSSVENLEQKNEKKEFVEKPKNFKKKKASSTNHDCNTLVYDLRRLFLKSEMSNLTIQAPFRLCEDDVQNLDVTKSNFKEFKVHKLILSSRSEVFQKMFSSDNELELSNSISNLCIRDFDAFTVEIFLNYLYTDVLEINFKNFKFNVNSTNEFNCNIDLKNINEDENDSDKSSDDELNDCKGIKTELCTHIFIELFKISDKYCVHRLKQICENQLIKLINVDNTVELLVVSYLHNSSKLKKKCFNSLAENISSIISQPSWTQLEKDYPALLSESFRVLYFKKRDKL
ncbi:unnamed protein product [Brachionus calyciflorus]|uniref:BTB domain-containing protein n=1 Tax=Brachionus calyciflorus TaxID=104777 RepID=A0A813N524_9BILA|nr:unnamed protein product [Brachionus calyciflorus]